MKSQTNGGSISKRGHGRKDESGADEEASARGRPAKAYAGQCQRGQHAKVTSSTGQRRQATMRPRKTGKETTRGIEKRAREIERGKEKEPATAKMLCATTAHIKISDAIAHTRTKPWNKY